MQKYKVLEALEGCVEGATIELWLSGNRTANLFIAAQLNKGYLIAVPGRGLNELEMFSAIIGSPFGPLELVIGEGFDAVSFTHQIAEEITRIRLNPATTRSKLRRRSP